MLDIKQDGEFIRLSGELQISFLESMHAKLSEVVHNPAPLTLDLSSIREVDLAGIQVLLSFMRTRGDDAATRVVGMPPLMHSALQLVGLEEAFARHLES